MSYTLTQTEYRNAKSALTRAKNSGDFRKVLNTAEKARLLFEAKGFPDDWNRWRNALWDAPYEPELRALAHIEEDRWI